MKCLLIKFTIGGVLFISQVSEEFIVNYEIVNSRNKLINIIDRKQNLQFNAISSARNYCDNTYSEGWSSSGMTKKFITKNSNYSYDQFGKCLKINYQNHSEGIIDDVEFETKRVEIYISKNHPLIAKHCFINKEIDWRILNNNPTLDYLDFPFLIHSYLEQGSERTSIFKVIEFVEREFTREEYRFIKKVLGQDVEDTGK